MKQWLIKNWIILTVAAALLVLFTSINIERGPDSAVIEYMVEAHKDTGMVFYAKYPRLMNGALQDDWNEQFAMLKDDLLAQTQARVQECVPLAGATDAPAIEASLNFQVMANSQGVLSILLDRYLAGGTTIDHRVIPINIDLHTGQSLDLFDLFKDEEAAKLSINRIIMDQIEARGLNDAMIAPFTSVDANTQYYLLEGFVVILFPRSELTPYYMGELTFAISQDILSELRLSKLS